MSIQFLAKIGSFKHSHPGPLADYLPTFTSFLYAQGYTPTSIHSKIKIIHNFNRWIEKRQIKVCELDEQFVRVFFQEHPRAGYVRRGDLSTLCLLLEWLRDAGVTRALLPKIDDSKLDSIECDFTRYLERERGLSQSTLRKYLSVTRSFLIERFGSNPIVLKEVCASDIIQFVLRHGRTISCRSAQLMTTALRGFFRFLRLRGDITSDLAASVPAVADWKLSTLPRKGVKSALDSYR